MRTEKAKAATGQTDELFPHDADDAVAVPTIALPATTDAFDEENSDVDFAQSGPEDIASGDERSIVDGSLAADHPSGPRASWDHLLRPPFAMKKHEWASYAERVRNGSAEGEDL
ncbi:MAG: hypothetical protein J0L92_19140 [Deltaproteobacteria bacterium]|nr:hypothetical protein [Deltaproteobacteria bacterium]